MFLAEDAFMIKCRKTGDLRLLKIKIEFNIKIKFIKKIGYIIKIELIVLKNSFKNRIDS